MECFTANIRVDEAALRFIKPQNTPNTYSPYGRKPWVNI